MATPLPGTKSGIRTVITEYADEKNCFSSGVKREKMEKLFENLGKDLAHCPDTKTPVNALTQKYRLEVDKIAAG